MSFHDGADSAPISMTNRGVLELPMAYGFKSAFDMAQEIPEGGQVADIGAGYSDLGRTVALFREDVTWTNFDIRYNEPTVIAKLKSKDLGLDNLRFLAGDVLSLPAELEPESFDRVYSFWLLPHFFSERGKLQTASRNMLSLLSEDGILRAGPIRKPGAKRPQAIMIGAASLDDPASLDHQTQELTGAIDKFCVTSMLTEPRLLLKTLLGKH